MRKGFWVQRSENFSRIQLQRGPSHDQHTPRWLSDPPSDRSLFKGRIDFQLAKKTFTTTGFSNGGVGFLSETPNPTISDPGRPGGLYEKEPDGSEFLDVGLDPELSFRITFRRI
ncbi:unnamed protein product [Camellia sinensis]